VNGWEITSLVNASLDAGFRPDEVKKAKLDWLDLESDRLRIPREDSSKNGGNCPPREAAFLLDEMSDIENDETRYPSVRSEARRLRRKAEAALIG
jgi:hypothetical protein